MNSVEGGSPRILHIHPDSPNGASARICLETVTGLGGAFAHDFAGGRIGSGTLETPGVRVNSRRLGGVPAISGYIGPGGMVRLARAMAGYDLVLTYGWGAINAAMAHKVFGRSFSLPPLIHHETGLGEAGDDEFSPWRNLYRRVALGSAQGVVVETSEVARRAAQAWQVPQSRLHIIPRAFEIVADGRKPAPDALPGLIKRKGECWAGTIIAGDDIRGVIPLIEQIVHLPANWHLVVFGERSALTGIKESADRLELSHRVHLPGMAGDRTTALALLDIYVDCSGGHAFPAAAIEAMAAGLPVVSRLGSPAAGLVSQPNRNLITNSDDATAFLVLAEEAQIRQEIGKANQVEVAANFGAANALTQYHALYSGALAGDS